MDAFQTSPGAAGELKARFSALLAARPEADPALLGALLREADALRVGEPQLRQWLREDGAGPERERRFAEAALQFRMRDNRDVLRRAAAEAAAFERELAAGREKNLAGIEGFFSVPRAGLLRAVEAERAALEKAEDPAAHLREIESRWRQEPRQRRETPAWAARHHLRFLASQQEERVEKAAQLLDAVLEPRGLSAEHFEKYLRQEQIDPRQRAAFHRALVVAASPEGRRALPRPAPLPASEPEDYRLELENERAAQAHRRLAGSLGPELHAFTGGRFRREMARLHAVRPHAPEETLSAEQRRLQSEVAEEIRLLRESQAFSREAAFPSALRKMLEDTEFRRAPGAPSPGAGPERLR
ncbi:MAG: hypothetical protein PW734_07245 [Verrucomicrobium sp.]|nr:hypothetical protein [Verrucomicrobium sp.]